MSEKGKKENTQFHIRSNLESFVAVKRDYSLLNDDFLDLLDLNKYQRENISKNNVRKLIL